MTEPPLSRKLREPWRYRAAAAGLVKEARLRAARRGAELTLGRIARGRGTIVAGPWLGEVGFEVLYWIPLLRWLQERYGMDPERVIAVSRGGADLWYEGLAGGYYDVLDHCSQEEIKQENVRRAREMRTHKQRTVSDFDHHVLRRVLDVGTAENATLLHPSLLYRLLRLFLLDRAPLSDVLDRASYRRLWPSARNGDDPLGGELPDEYVAVKPYFSASFPDIEENRAFVVRLLSALSDRIDVVLLSTGIDIDDHEDYMVSGGRVHSVEHLMTPRNNLAVQTRVIGGAEALFATYGGFSYLGPFLGVPSISFHSDEHSLRPYHLDVMRRAAKQLGDAAFVSAHVREFPLLELAAALPRAREAASA
jgi:hypothetical protein